MKKILFFVICFVGFLFANSLQEILQNKEIRVGIRVDFPPLGTLKDDKLQGFEVDLSKKIFKEVFKDKNVSVKFVGVTSKNRISFLDENKIDVAFAALAQTPSRVKQVDFSMPYLTTNMAIISKKGGDFKMLDDFKSKTLLVIPKTASDEFINKNQNKFVNIKIKNCSGLNDCFAMLQNGEADGYFHSILAIGILPILYPDYEIGVGLVGKSDLVGCAVKKGNKELLKVINNEIIKLMSTSFFKDAYHNSFDVYYKGKLDKKYFLLDNLYSRFL